MGDSFELDVVDEEIIERRKSKWNRFKQNLIMCRLHLFCLGMGIVLLLGLFVLSGYGGYTIARATEKDCPKPSKPDTQECVVDPVEEEDDGDVFTDVDGVVRMFYETLLKNTTESQIDIYQPENWIDRDEQVDIWMNFMNQNSRYLNTSDSVVTEAVRQQYLMNVAGCSSHDEFRVRVYVVGDGAGQTTIDSKVNDHVEYNACTAPFGPSSIYLTNSSMKCERDIHECSSSDKYSRETRIFFKDYFPQLSICKDMLNLYPDAFPKMHYDTQWNATVSTNNYSDWWVKKYTGYIENDTKYEITFTLYYGTQYNAITGGVEPINGEWSIRLYSLGDGFVDKWNDDVVDDIANLYSEMITTFGRPGNCN